MAYGGVGITVHKGCTWRGWARVGLSDSCLCRGQGIWGEAVAVLTAGDATTAVSRAEGVGGSGAAVAVPRGRGGAVMAVPRAEGVWEAATAAPKAGDVCGGGCQDYAQDTRWRRPGRCSFPNVRLAPLSPLHPLSGRRQRVSTEKSFEAGNPPRHRGSEPEPNRARCARNHVSRQSTRRPRALGLALFWSLPAPPRSRSLGRPAGNPLRDPQLSRDVEERAAGRAQQRQ